MLFVHQFEYLMLNYCNIEVYLKTWMLGAINQLTSENVWLIS